MGTPDLLPIHFNPIDVLVEDALGDTVDLFHDFIDNMLNAKVPVPHGSLRLPLPPPLVPALAAVPGSNSSMQCLQWQS